MQGKGQGCGLTLAFQSELQKLVTQCRHLSLRNELEESGSALMTEGLTALLDSVLSLMIV